MPCSSQYFCPKQTHHQPQKNFDTFYLKKKKKIFHICIFLSRLSFVLLIIKLILKAWSEKKSIFFSLRIKIKLKKNQHRFFFFKLINKMWQCMQNNVNIKQISLFYLKKFFTKIIFKKLLDIFIKSCLLYVKVIKKIVF